MSELELTLSVQEVLDGNIVDVLVGIDRGVPEDVLGFAHELLGILVAQSSNVVANVGSFLCFD